MPSSVWEHFEKAENGGTCKIGGCGKDGETTFVKNSTSSSSTSAYWSHLKVIFYNFLQNIIYLIFILATSSSYSRFIEKKQHSTA